MKGIVILIIVLVIGFIIYAAGRKQEVEASKAKQSAQTQVVQEANAKKKASKTEQVVQEISDTASYATGAAQVRAGVKAKNKIQQIQDMKNAKDAQAIKEMENQ